MNGYGRHGGDGLFGGMREGYLPPIGGGGAGSIPWYITDPSTWTNDGTFSVPSPTYLKAIVAAGGFLYLLDSNDVRQYLIPEDGDVTGLTLVATYTSLDTSVNDISVSEDGRYMAYANGSNPPYIRTYELLTPHDFSTKVLLSEREFSYYGSSPRGIHFDDNGLDYFVTTYNSNTGEETYRNYAMSSSWDLTTQAQQSSTSSFRKTPNSSSGLYNQFFDLDQSNRRLYTIEVSGKWGDLSVATQTYKSLAGASYPSSMAFSADGAIAYCLNAASYNRIDQYTTDATV